MEKRPPRLPTRASTTPRVSQSDVLTAHSAQSPEPAQEQSTSPIRRGHLSSVEEEQAPNADPEANQPESDASDLGWKEQRAKRRADRIRRVWSSVEDANPYTTFWLILGSTVALGAIGLTMVLSSTSAVASGETFAVFSRQAAWAGVGAVAMVVMTFMPRRLMGGFGWFLMLLSAVLLALVVFTPLGLNINGSTNWIQLGPIQGQPSEIAKLALVLWGAAVLSRKGPLVTQLTHWLVPFVLPGALSILVLVLAGGDLGTSIILTVIVGAMLFIAGVALRYFLMAASGALAAILLLMLLTPYRMARVYTWLGTNCDAPSDPCHQTQQGYYALASGGFWGVGLGQSRQRWGYIPEVHNDFIFTILGEELGLLGTLLVLGLFALLAVGIFRVAFATTDRFTRLVCVGIAAWLIGQAFINIGMVTGVIPVVGVPLPFISAGGSALTVCLMAIGIVLNLARRQRMDARRARPKRRRSSGRSTLTPLHSTPVPS